MARNVLYRKGDRKQYTELTEVSISLFAMFLYCLPCTTTSPYHALELGDQQECSRLPVQRVSC